MDREYLELIQGDDEDYIDSLPLYKPSVMRRLEDAIISGACPTDSEVSYYYSVYLNLSLLLVARKTAYDIHESQQLTGWRY